MASRICNMSIRRKLLVSHLLTTFVALLLTCAGLFVYDVTTSKRELVKDLDTLSTLVAESSATALYFEDRDSARDAIGVLLQVERVETVWTAKAESAR